MSDDDKRTYRQLLLIAVFAVCAILFLFTIGTLYAEWACFQFHFEKLEMPEVCGNGSLTKFALEFVGLAIGVIAAVKLLGQ
jgi:hypothetical protein